MPKIRNILIFVGIAAALILGYVLFLKPSSSDQASLVSSSGTGSSASATGSANTTSTSASDSSVAQNFLTLLLNVRTIKLDDSIFSDPAFTGLHDSSITLTPDGTQGRPNPFAQFGDDTPPPSTTQTTTSTTTTTNTATGATTQNTNTTTGVAPITPTQPTQ